MLMPILPSKPIRGKCTVNKSNQMGSGVNCGRRHNVVYCGDFQNDTFTTYDDHGIQFH